MVLEKVNLSIYLKILTNKDLEDERIDLDEHVYRKSNNLTNKIQNNKKK